MSTYKRPEITDKLIDTIRQLIADNPDKGRTRLSVMLCEIWDWRDSKGRTKDMSCRDMLNALDKAGKITLPAPKKVTRRPGDSKGVKHLIHDETPINCKLKELQPLRIEVVTSKADWQQIKSYIDQYHYLKFDRCISESMAYLVRSHDGKPLASLLFGSTAWSCRDRDAFIGWTKEERRVNLIMTTNNSRFIILPWVSVPHLASHILSIISKRISADWEQKYGHSICLLETFVESGRFKGTCYKAANWIHVGKTTGRGRNGGHNNAIVPIKDIYLYPLSKAWQTVLLGDKAGKMKEQS
ncbi:MAG: DUF4338 domain-containing protein [Candidatus Methanofastidiosum sp.]|nr:DUF4338 domain-containing protein [Methanofastidiosum sp.]